MITITRVSIDRAFNESVKTLIYRDHWVIENITHLYGDGDWNSVKNGAAHTYIHNNHRDLIYKMWLYVCLSLFNLRLYVRIPAQFECLYSFIFNKVRICILGVVFLQKKTAGTLRWFIFRIIIIYLILNTRFESRHEKWYSFLWKLLICSRGARMCRNLDSVKHLNGRIVSCW